MSGGSHNYICYQIDEHLVGKMHDRELDDMMRDVSELAHDLEWADSDDISEEDYRKTVLRFKTKWFGQAREERLKKYIDDSIYSLREELYAMIGNARPTHEESRNG